MNTIIKRLSLPLVGFALLASGCSQRPEKIPVIAPKTAETGSIFTPEDKEATLFSRPVSMGYISNWKATNGVSLFSTPSDLDVIVIEENPLLLTPAMEIDLARTREIKRTKVFCSNDLQALEKEAKKEFKKRFSAKTRAKKEEWKNVEGDNKPSKEQQEKELKELEATINTEVAKEIQELATKQIVYSLSIMPLFDGLNLKLPEKAHFLSQTFLNELLKKVTDVCGGTDAPLLIIQNPIEEARSYIEKATWIVFGRKVIENKVSDFTEEAQQWPNNRYLPLVNLADGNKDKGYATPIAFSPEKALPCEEDIINWKAPNRAGVAYEHIEHDAAYDGNAKKTYPTLNHLIKLIYTTK